MKHLRLAWFLVLAGALAGITALSAQVPVEKAPPKAAVRVAPPAPMQATATRVTVSAAARAAPVIAPELADELVLRAAGLSADGPALLDFLRKRTRGAADPSRLRELVRQLGDPSAVERERAVGELVAVGDAALPGLRVAAKDVDDHDRSANARRCL